MKRFQRELNALAMLLSLIAAGVLTDVSTGGSLKAAVIGLCQCGNPQCTGCNQGHPETQAPSGNCGCAAGPVEVVYSHPATTYTSPETSCGCAAAPTAKAKRGFKSRGKQRSCPQCDCEFCELDVKKGEVEKTGYKIEQKEVCVPSVWLPWKTKCPPKRSKVRTVNTLKKHKYKCPQCEYKWSVHEPEDADQPAGSGKKETAPASVKEAPTGSSTRSAYPDPTESLGDVPRPPLEK